MEHNIENNNADDTNNNVMKYGDLFKIPIGGQFADVRLLVEDSIGDFEKFEAERTAGASLSVEQLRANLAALAPAARVAVCELECFEVNFKPYSREEEIRAPRVQGPPIFALFALNALALYEAEQGSGPSTSAQPSDVVSTLAAPSSNIVRYPMEPQDWQEASKSLNFSSSFANAVYEGTGVDWASNLDEAQLAIRELRKAQGALAWCLEEFQELTANVLNDRNEDVKGYAEILGLPLIEVAATELLDSRGEVHSETLAGPATKPAPAGPGGPPTPPAKVGLGGDEENPNWIEVAQALKRLGDYVEGIPDGDEVHTTANFCDAAPFLRALVLVRRSFPKLERVYLEAVDEEIRYAETKVRDYTLLKELDNPDFDAIDNSPVS